MLKPEVIKAFMVTAELTGTPLTRDSAEVAVEHLCQYETDLVLRALNRCRIELRGPLTLGAVMDRLDDGYPGPEAAWAMVSKLDDGATVVWTDEMAEAFHGVRGMLEDRVQARMAFLEVYRTKLAEARAVAKVPRWWPSLGWDASQRAAAITEAVELRRLSVTQAMTMLPSSDWPPAWDQARALPAHVDPETIAQRKSQIRELTASLGQKLASEPDTREPADEQYFETLRREVAAAEKSAPARP
jgi:hypothetical protein